MIAPTKFRLASAMPTLVLIGLCAAISLIEPRFMSIDNLIRIATASTAPLMLALGVTFVIIMGSIDLSVEGAMAFSSAVLAAGVANAANTGLNLGLAALPLVVLGTALFGALVGFIHVFLKVPSFMASLGMSFIGLGMATVLLGGERVVITDQYVRALTLTRVLNLPIAIYVAAVMFFAAWVIENHTIFGRHVYALGGAEHLVVASGVNANRVRILAFALSGFFIGVGSILASARLGASSVSIWLRTVVHGDQRDRRRRHGAVGRQRRRGFDVGRRPDRDGSEQRHGDCGSADLRPARRSRRHDHHRGVAQPAESRSPRGEVGPLRCCN